MVQLHPGLSTEHGTRARAERKAIAIAEVSDEVPLAQVRQLAERLGLNPRGCRFDSGLGHF